MENNFNGYGYFHQDTNQNQEENEKKEENQVAQPVNMAFGQPEPESVETPNEEESPIEETEENENQEAEDETNDVESAVNNDASQPVPEVQEQPKVEEKVEEVKQQKVDEVMPNDEYNNFDNFEPVAKIKVIGVGGAGNNAVNRMIDENISSIEFYVMNTDKQALSTSKARNRLVLGKDTYRGLGAGGDPRIGEMAAQQSEEEIRKVVHGADMVFIAAGEGGGTGTGASPIIARIAREEGALTVAIVTRPFGFEGKRRISQAVEGLNKLKEHVDSIIIVSNDKLLMMSGQNSVGSAFAESDKVLAQSVKTVADLILMPAIINLDFADVKSTLKDSGLALIGFGTGSGPNKVQEAASAAISSPLLEASIRGARSAIISVTCGNNVTLFEAKDAANEIMEAAGNNLDIKFGVMLNPELTDQILVSVIATEFDQEFDFTATPTINFQRPKAPEAEAPVEAVETKAEEKDDSILPNFLKNNRF